MTPVLPKDTYFEFARSIPLYFYNIYNIDTEYDESNIIYTDTIEEAYELYLKNSGTEISSEELEKKDFQKLLDKHINKSKM